MQTPDTPNRPAVESIGRETQSLRASPLSGVSDPTGPHDPEYLPLKPEAAQGAPDRKCLKLIFIVGAVLTGFFTTLQADAPLDNAEPSGPAPPPIASAGGVERLVDAGAPIALIVTSAGTLIGAFGAVTTTILGLVTDRRGIAHEAGNGKAPA
ncbi:hypothetical protein LMG24235_07885 [Paraburkholderia sabiae]|nr:hypothetical protein LMG24235_07885 [Paraburkholderia sabiae]